MQKTVEIAIRAALEAGKEILSIYSDPTADFGIERKADNSPLTIADKRSNETILSYLKTTPYPVLSEESAIVAYEERKKWDTLWIVDPLDGTKEFIKRNGEFTVNIALVTKGVPVAGVIYVPVKRELYFGTLMDGAFKISHFDETFDTNFEYLQSIGTRLPINHSHDSFIVVASRSHQSPETENYIKKLHNLHHPVELTSVGSSIKICLVAEGAADIYPRFAPTMEWDTAAGHAIAKAAGKEIYTTDEIIPLGYNKENLLNPWFIVKTANNTDSESTLSH